MSDSRSRRQWGQWAAGLMALAVGCGPVEELQQHESAPPTLSWSPAQTVTALSCREIKTAQPSAPDGLYWLNTPTGAVRVYCDMLLNGGTELCRDGVEQEVTGRTRDGSNLSYRMRTILRPSQNVCEIWNVRHATNGSPLGHLYKVAGNTLSTCQALGFRQDGQLGQCNYGDQYSNCGFTANLYYRYGNSCVGCHELNNGQYSSYTLQGYMHLADLLSDVSGTVRTTCTVAATSCEQDPALCGTSSSHVAGGCSHIKAVNSSAADGVYWIQSASGPVKAYCDMQQVQVLCSQQEATRQGRTRDASRLTYKMRSILRTDTATGTDFCELWAVQQTPQGNPLGALAAVAGNTMSTCQALGFRQDRSVGLCRYGSAYTDCGFTSGTYYRYGNSCNGCTLNNGDFSYYVLQGNMGGANVISNMSGTVRTQCGL